MSHEVIEILIQTTLAVASATVGATILFFIKLNHHKLCSLISFSAGALFGAAVFTFLPEAFEKLSFIELIISISSGIGLFWFISHYIIHVCPACSASHFDEQTTKKFTEIVKLLFVVLSFHSFLDGVAVSTAGFHSHGESVITAILTHKLPEGLALASLMLGAGYSKLRIIRDVVLVESTTILGGLFGVIFLNQFVDIFWLGIIEAHIAGGFLFLAIHAVIGEVFKNHKLMVALSFIGGIALVVSIGLLFHAH
ncbi:MAG: ZIP family metal transporter [Ignavibacteriaceae bacterium]|nr:ZIP family metal transporter [Ignavibacteriaceae bacterium]